MVPAAAPRVHGMGTALAAPTWPAITAPEAEAVLRHFPVAGRMLGLRWHSPRPFSAATLVQGSGGEFFLKRHDGRLRTLAALAEEQAFSRHLGRAGIRVPEIVRAADGTGAVVRGPWSYELHRTAPGLDLYRDRPSWTPFLSCGHAHAAGVALARLHVAARGFAAPARAARPLVASFTILPAADPLAAAEAFVAARPALGGFLAAYPWRAELARLFAALGGGVAQGLATQPAAWTHNDWHPSNLLWTREGTVDTVFDFGLSDRSCALVDLAIAIERSAVRWLELGEGADDGLADVEAAQALLAGYASVCPLGASERALVARLLPLVHVEFALSEIDYFHGIVAEPAHAALAWEGYLVGHAEWFLSGAGQDLLQRIAG